MADSDKDILITPNTGAATDPSIVFSSGATGGDDVTLFVTDDGTITTLSIEGSAGQLFSVSNDLTGTIFSVNDISGIPSLEVNADGTVSIAEFDGDVGIGTSSPSAQLHVIADSATTNADIPVLRITSTSTGTPATGIGPSIEFESETAAGAPGNLEIGGVLAIEATDVTATTEDFDFVFSTMAAGAAAAERMRISSAGTVTATSFSGANVTSGADPGHTHTSASITSVAAANISAGNLGSGVLPYATVDTAASAYKIPFLNTTGTASGNFGLLHDTTATFTYNPSTNTLTVGPINAGAIDSTGTITASTYFKVDAANANGYGFWNGPPTTYGIYMSQAAVQGRIGGETTSDYNQYFEMNSGTNRGFVFETDATKLFAINPDGVRSAVALTVTGTMAATTVTGANVTSGADPGHTHGAGSVPNHDSLTGFVANEHIDWTADSGSQIQVDNLAVDRSYAGVSTVTPQYSYVGYDRFSGGIDNDLILDAGIFGLASGDTNGAGNGTFNPMLVMRNSSDVRVQASFPRENSNPIAYRGYHTAAWQTWHYTGWTTTEANADLTLYPRKAENATITGSWNFNTATDTVPFYISRLGTSTEALEITVDDNYANITLNQDETGATAHGMIFDLNTTSTGEHGYYFRDQGGNQVLFDITNSTYTFNGALEVVAQSDHPSSFFSGGCMIWARSESLGDELYYTAGDNSTIDHTLQNVMEAGYQFSNSTAATDPGAGVLRYNNATPASVTNLYIDDLESTGKDASYLLSNLADGDIIKVRDVNAAGAYLVASVNGTPTDNTGWWTVPVTVIHSGTLPLSTSPLQVDVEWSGSQGGGSGTVTSVAAGNGLDFTTITTTGSVTLGTPGTTTASSSNAVTATSHTHAVDNTIRQGLTDNASITTAGWYRIATNSASAGRGGATIYISNSGGGDSPDPTMIRINKSYGATLNDATITVVSSGKQGSSSLDGVRIIFDQVTNNEIYVEVNIGTGSAATWTHYIVPDNTLGTWASVDYTTGATADFALTWDLSTDSVQSGCKMGNGAAQWFDANGIFRIDGRNVASANSGIEVDARGDAYLRLLADRTSDTETEQAYVLFSQDAGAVAGVIGTCDTAKDSEGNTFTGMGNNGLAIHHKYATGTISLGVNGSTGLTVDDNDRVYIGQDRTGYFTAVTGNYGSVQVAGAEGSSGTWAGYSIAGGLVFMQNNGTTTTNRGGIYDDLNNRWVIQWNSGGVGAWETSIYHAGTVNIGTQTYNTTANTSGAYIRDHANVLRDIGFNHVKEVAMTTANITLDDIHAGTIIRRTGTSTVTLTVAAGSAFPVGSMCTVLNHGTGGSLTISDGSEAMYIMDGSGTVTDSLGFALAIGGCITIWRQGTSAYYVWGAGIP